jgi:KaiC/GvpD/RAD55 family RecA-like ATPase
MCVFGVVVMWSIYTSGKKAFQLRKAEKIKEAKEKGDYVEMEETPMEMMESAANTSVNDQNTSLLNKS